jgi:O-antigen/teichoic acid export membrane protein
MARGILGQAGPLMLGRAGATALSFALPLVLTRLLPQSEFGTYKQVWLVVTTAYFMLPLGLAQSLYYFIPRKDGRA